MGSVGMPYVMSIVMTNAIIKEELAIVCPIPSPAK
jgi:hypothetical protein